MIKWFINFMLKGNWEELLLFELFELELILLFELLILLIIGLCCSLDLKILNN